MFGGKKNKLPPRPSLPSSEQILDDLKTVNFDDMAFNIMPKDNTQSADLHFPTNVNDAENIYIIARRYLDGVQRLKILDKELHMEQEGLKVNYEKIVKLAQEIRDQAQAVLLK